MGAGFCSLYQGSLYQGLSVLLGCGNLIYVGGCCIYVSSVVGCIY